MRSPTMRTAAVRGGAPVPSMSLAFTMSVEPWTSDLPAQPLSANIASATICTNAPERSARTPTIPDLRLVETSPTTTCASFIRV